MQILSITLGDKTYSTGRFPAKLYREIVRISGQRIVLAETRQAHAELEKKLKEASAAGQPVTEMLDTMHDVYDQIMHTDEDIYSRQLWVICETYGNQFTVSDLEDNLSVSEIESQTLKIAQASRGVFAKN